LEVETALVQGQVAIQADAEIIVQDGRSGEKTSEGTADIRSGSAVVGQDRSRRLSKGLCGKALKEE